MDDGGAAPAAALQVAAGSLVMSESLYVESLVSGLPFMVGM